MARVYIHPLDSHCNQALIDCSPQLQDDFWYVEHVVPDVLRRGGMTTETPDEADLFLVPHYSACEYASRLYRRGLSPAHPDRDERTRATREVGQTFARVMRQLRRGPSWRAGAVARHLFVFGQGLGADQGDIWTQFPQMRGARVLGVEARPTNHRAFRVGVDVVIPPHQPHSAIANAVRLENLERQYLVHFRGRAWGYLRPAILAALRTAGSDVFIAEDSPYRMGGEGCEKIEADIWSYYREMRRAIFALCPAGWTSWTLRFYEAMQVGSIPVIVPGTFVPPFADVIDYSRCTIKVSFYDLPRMPQLLRGIPESMIEDMLGYQDEVRELLDWNGRAGDLLSQELDRVVTGLRH